MNKSFLTLGAAFVLGASLSTATVQAEDTATSMIAPFSVDASLDLVSMYNWRGIPVVDDPVVQPSVTLNYEGFALNWWANYDLTDTGKDNDFSEHDITLSYTYEYDLLSLTGGVIYYYFPNLGEQSTLSSGRTVGDDNDTAEVFLSATYDVFLAPTFTAYYDFDEAEGFYLNASISHTIPLAQIDENLSLELGADIGWMSEEMGEFYFQEKADGTGTNGDGFSNVGAKATLAYQVNEHFSISWYVAGAYIISDEFGDSVEAGGKDDTNFWTGVSFGFSY